MRRLTGDVDTMILPGDNRISNAPQLPKHPIYTGETSRDRREFVKKYQSYYNTLLAYETCQNKPFVMPVSACVDARTRAQIVKFEMCKQPEDAVEEDWINYFREAITTDSFELGNIDEIMENFKMRTRLMDAGSRMSRLRNQIYRVLEEEGLQLYVEQVDAKKIVDWMVEGLEPAAFRRKIQEKLNMDTNKHLKKNLVAFYQWCLGQLRSFMEWEPEATRV